MARQHYVCAVHLKEHIADWLWETPPLIVDRLYYYECHSFVSVKKYKLGRKCEFCRAQAEYAVLPYGVAPS